MPIIDASVAAKWFIAEPDSDVARALAELPDPVAPDLLLAEVTNILWKAERQGRLLAADAERAVETLPSWFERIVPVTDLAGRALVLARSLGHPAYDCFYLALAEREGTILLTGDNRLLASLRGTAWAHLAGHFAAPDD